MARACRPAIMASWSRPTTAMSRPPTARPQTGVSTVMHPEGNYVIALLEGRGVSREIGFAALDRDTGNLVLVQVRIHLLIRDIELTYHR